MLWKLALQFTRRQWRRNLLVIGAIAVSVFVMVFLSSIMAGIKDQYLAENVRQGGHLRLHAAGWADRTDPLALSPALGDPKGLEKLALTVPGVVGAEAVLSFGAMLLNGDKNLFVEADGVEADGASTSLVRDRIVAGTFDGSPGHLLLSTRTAQLLGWTSGVPLVVLTQDADGIPQYRSLDVAGTFDTGNPGFDEGHVFLAHQTAQDLTNLVDQTLEVRLELAHPDDADRLRGTVASLVAGNQGEVETWQESLGSFLVFLQITDIFTLGIDFLLVLVAAAVIANSILMNFLERLPVLCSLRAIGLKERQTLGLVLREGVLLGAVGSTVGILAGIAVVAPLVQHGWPLAEVGRAFGIGATIPFLLQPMQIFVSAIAGLVTVLVASLYAGRIGSRTPILDGLVEE